MVTYQVTQEEEGGDPAQGGEETHRARSRRLERALVESIAVHEMCQLTEQRHPSAGGKEKCPQERGNSEVG